MKTQRSIERGQVGVGVGEKENEVEVERSFRKPTKYQILFPEQEMLVLFVCFSVLFDCFFFRSFVW